MTVLYFDAFRDGYVEAALWADCVPYSDDPDVEITTGGLNETYSVHDVDADDLARLEDRLRDFAAEYAADLDAYCDRSIYDTEASAYAGHDLRLTAGGHGAGYWDRGMGELGDRLTEGAKAFGDHFCYVDETGSVRVDA